MHFYQLSFKDCIKTLHPGAILECVNQMLFFARFLWKSEPCPGTCASCRYRAWELCLGTWVALVRKDFFGAHSVWVQIGFTGLEVVRFVRMRPFSRSPDWVLAQLCLFQYRIAVRRKGHQVWMQSNINATSPSLILWWCEVNIGPNENRGRHPKVYELFIPAPCLLDNESIPLRWNAMLVSRATWVKVCR